MKKNQTENADLETEEVGAGEADTQMPNELRRLLDLLEAVSARNEARARRRDSEEDGTVGIATASSFLEVKSKAVGLLKKQSMQHVMAVLEKDNRLTRRFWVKDDEHNDMPFALFVLHYIDRKPLTGMVVNVELVRDGTALIRNEIFSGVALEVMASDLDEDGFREVDLD